MKVVIFVFLKKWTVCLVHEGEELLMIINAAVTLPPKNQVTWLGLLGGDHLVMSCVLAYAERPRLNPWHLQSEGSQAERAEGSLQY